MNKINRFLPLILSIAIITPLSNDLFIPSLPEIGQVFHTNKTQLLLSVFMFGLAGAQIFYGPLLDRFGRKLLLIIGLSIYIVASGFMLVTHSFSGFLIGRFLQAIGACCTIPAAMAILRDVYTHEKLLTAVSYLMSSIVIIPVLAPFIGAHLAYHFGWISNFIVLLLVGIFYWFLIVFLFKETLVVKNHKALNYQYVFRIYRALLTHKNCLGFILSGALMYAALFTYIAAAPFLLIQDLKVPLQNFGWYFLMFATALGLTTFIVPKLGKHVALHALILISIGLFLIAITIMGLLNYSFGDHLWLLVGPMILTGIGIGVVRPAATTGMMKIIPPKIAGISSSLMNVVMFAVSAVATSVVAILHLSILSFTIMMFIIGLLALGAACLTLNSNRAFDVEI